MVKKFLSIEYLFGLILKWIARLEAFFLGVIWGAY